LIEWQPANPYGGPIKRAPSPPELSPTEARSGIISGRIFMILLISSVGAVAALALAWYFLFPYGGQP